MQTNTANQSMNTDDDLAVIISPQAFDLNTYQPFNDEGYRKTIDEILSDETSFNNSFDEYTGGGGTSERMNRSMMGGTFGKPFASKERDDARARLSGQKKSPYFPSQGVQAKKAAVTQRTITRIDAESGTDTDTDADMEPEPEAESARENGVEKEDLDGRMEVDTVPQSDGANEAELTSLPVGDIPSEENAIFASIGFEQHVLLKEYLSLHPFLRDSGYPVGRHARRGFVHELRGKAGELGMDPVNIDNLVKYLKKLYLEVWAQGLTIHNNDRESSEFGDEFEDDEKKSKKERKRKRRSSHMSKEKSKKNKHKRTGSDGVRSPPVIVKREAVDDEDAMGDLPSYVPESFNDELADVAMDAPTNMADFGSAELMKDGGPIPSGRDSLGKAEYHSGGGLESVADQVHVDAIAGNEYGPGVTGKGLDAETEPATLTERTDMDGKPHENDRHNNDDFDLRGSPISYDHYHEDNGKVASQTDLRTTDVTLNDFTQGDTSQNHTSRNGIGHICIENVGKKMNTTPSKPLAESSGKSDRNRERNRQKRLRIKRNKAARKQQLLSDSQPATDSKQRPQGRLQKRGQNVNRHSHVRPDAEEDPLTNYKPLDDPFWELDF